MKTRIIRGLRNIRLCDEGAVVTIGNFDGIHKGHEALLDRVKAEAHALGVSSMVITFEPQPHEFFARERSVPRLTRIREKFSLLSKAGLDKVLVIRFNPSFAALTSEEFIKKVLCEQLKIKAIIVGNDFRYGKLREGDVTLLKKMGKDLEFQVEVMPDILIENQRVSSTWVRLSLLAANHSLAERLLGRPYTMMGRVVYGDQIGRKLGFPTANIHLHRHVSPVLGVYAVRLHGLTKKPLPGVANVGLRPTVEGTRALLEVHLFDFNENIYGKKVSVEFCEKMRDEERFSSLDLLKEQIVRDAKKAREYFIRRGDEK